VVEGKRKTGEVSRAKKRRLRKIKSNEENGEKEKSVQISNGNCLFLPFYVCLWESVD
jgi:hypothetical protein